MTSKPYIPSLFLLRDKAELRESSKYREKSVWGMENSLNGNRQGNMGTTRKRIR